MRSLVSVLVDGLVIFSPSAFRSEFDMEWFEVAVVGDAFGERGVFHVGQQRQVGVGVL
ncbi:hypothetical protein GCM10027444_24580 [Actinopolyspora lacussalsi]